MRFICVLSNVQFMVNYFNMPSCCNMHEYRKKCREVTICIFTPLENCTCTYVLNLYNNNNNNIGYRTFIKIPAHR